MKYLILFLLFFCGSAFNVLTAQSDSLKLNWTPPLLYKDSLNSPVFYQLRIEKPVDFEGINSSFNLLNRYYAQRYLAHCNEVNREKEARKNISDYDWKVYSEDSAVGILQMLSEFNLTNKEGVPYPNDSLQLYRFQSLVDDLPKIKFKDTFFRGFHRYDVTQSLFLVIKNQYVPCSTHIFSLHYQLREKGGPEGHNNYEGLFFKVEKIDDNLYLAYSLVDGYGMNERNYYYRTPKQTKNYKSYVKKHGIDTLTTSNFSLAVHFIKLLTPSDSLWNDTMKAKCNYISRIIFKWDTGEYIGINPFVIFSMEKLPKIKYHKRKRTLYREYFDVLTYTIKKEEFNIDQILDRGY